MRVLFLGTTDNHGGAARAGFRMFKGLKETDLDVKMFVNDKYSADNSVFQPSSKAKKYIARFIFKAEKIFYSRYKNKKPGLMTTGQWSKRCVKEVCKLNADILHFHWVSGALFSIGDIASFKKPIVWTLHDMWAFTGGCHYSENCDRYTLNCGKCPKLGSNSKRDISSYVLSRKMNLWKRNDFTIICPSKWLAECASQSSLFKDRRIEYIPYGIDLEEFKPHDKAAARELMNLEPNKKYILFGAMSATTDKRKGFHLLKEAMDQLSQNHNLKEEYEIIVFGAEEPANPENLGFKINYLGQVNDSVTLRLMYSSADVLVAPSMEDNLPLTIMESLACGTPVVGFEVGGIPDMIEHERNGYLVKKFDTIDLANGITWVLENPERWQQLSQRARTKMLEEFELSLIVRKHQELYQSLFRDN
ncbi:MAG: glycosyltransferase family 4 protein [Bacteroidia bacterium]|nr:glycosyltransferase family 4 protein [Bacteroidia bacterium]